MEREIRYCTTSDGVRIAYAESGEGPVTLVQAPNLYLSAIHMEVLATRQRFVDLLNARFHYVRFDHRATGMSQRDVDDLSQPRWIEDLEAVANRIDGRFALFGYLSGACVALWYAMQHPDRVSHLLLWPPPVVEVESPQSRAIGQLAIHNWELFTENYAHEALGWDQSAEAHHLAQVMLETISRETFFRYWTASVPYFRGTEPFEQLVRDSAGIKAPTLIMQRQGGADDPILGQLAAVIPDARLRIFAGDAGVPTIGEIEPVVDAMAAFCGVREALAPTTVAPGPRFMTILFTDVVDHGAMMQRLGDDAGRVILREHEALTRQALEQHGGVEVKTAGDGFMVSFESVTAATECAITLQRTLAERNAIAAEPIHVRCGLNAGEPIAEDGDYFGSSVNLAARVAALAGTGEILLPEPVRHLLAGRDLRFEDRGEVMLKGFSDPMRVYAVLWQ